ncbi:ankyrin repeat-containing protein [Prunus yedoensis var. nudiflora]|uniref:Ankyrin repeat-containing protein n=1 Tax=Prunus yedoensis var. nudiflora TaxID=2094558 RepID=A0A314YY65_PRUYE|nr:ankyrin repeat-containing protein [Prunus yedoensis var. nudiflora]
MDPSLYRAARSGDLGFLRTARDNNILDQKTPKDNNVLHVAAEFKQIDFFENAPLDDQSPLFWATNKKGNTPLHVAARVGCHEVVKFLIEHALRTLIDPADQESGPADANAHKELLRKTNSQKDTALHVAVRNGHVGVVTLLVEADPQLCSFTNSANESPLFLAVRNGSANVVLYILNESPILPSFHGTNGVTALHMAVTRKHLTGRSIVETMVSKIPGIIREVDELGWTPLHYAALGRNLEATRVLLQLDSDASYILDKSGLSALHVAAYAGCTKIMEEMIGCRPDTCDLLNDKGQTILHAAVLGEQINVVNYILKNPKLAGLINEVDNDGNTPLHLAARQHNRQIITTLTQDRRVDKTATTEEFSQAVDFFLGDNFGEQESISLLDRQVLRHLGRSVGIPFFQQQITSDFKKPESPGSIALKKEKRQAHSDQVPKGRDTILLVVTLIATVTFVAALNVPGGFKSNGKAALADSPFSLFFITFDVAAFSLAFNRDL